MTGLETIDDETRLWFQEQWTSVGDIVMADVTALGGYTLLTVVTLFAVGLLLALKRYRAAWFLVAAGLGGWMLSESLKLLIARPRPEIVHPFVVAPPRSFSFPSGHAMLSSVVYLTLALVAAPHLPGRRVRRYVLGSSLVLVFLIGVSRLYLGVHHLSDVLAGWCAGIAWALACRWVEHHWRPLRREEDMSNAEPNSGPAGSAGGHP
jgi:undecaprenyl-diphosphatase